MTARPISTRKSGIQEKLDYAEAQHNELLSALFGSYETDQLPKFVSVRVEGILSNTRECFDHLARDIVEGHVLPGASAKFTSDFHDGSFKTYFPFYPGQLKQKPWAQLKTANRELFDALSGFVDAIEGGKKLGRTSHAVKDFRTVQEMVNAKKHSSVTAYEPIPGAAVFHKGPAGSVLMSRDQAALPGLKVGAGFGGERPKVVPTFKFSSNGRDVADISLFAVFATRVVMDWFYESYFAATGQRIETHPTMMLDGVETERPHWVYD
jgi:hypothetical protein